tara:strand:- start:908 stop:1114 length:207 start_codon:yes stop_codon:yes gene_type:complete
MISAYHGAGVHNWVAVHTPGIGYEVTRTYLVFTIRATSMSHAHVTVTTSVFVEAGITPALVHGIVINT